LVWLRWNEFELDNKSASIMARILNVKTEDIRTAIQLEGRPWANTARSENTDGSQLVWDANDMEWKLGSKSTFSAGSITIAPGRAIYVESIIVSSDQAGFMEGFLRYNDGADFIGTEDVNTGGAIDGFIRVATNGGPVVIPVNRIYSEFFNVSLTRFVPAKFTPSVQVGTDPVVDHYVRPTPIEPSLAITVTGIEITNDLNFGAAKRLGFAGDSLSWSLIGDYRTQDLGYNVTGSNASFPPNFGDNLAAFRLINALRAGGEDIRLVNKGFGGSTLLKEQWYAMKTGMYTYPWNIFILQAGANDSSNVQTPLYQLTFKERMRDFCSRRLQDGHTYQDAGVTKPYPMVFCTAPSLDDKSKGRASRNNLDVRPPLTGESYNATFTASDSAEVAIDLAQGTWLKVDGSNDTIYPMYLDNGTVGSIYRIDFTTTVTLSVAGSGKPLVRVIESLEGDNNDDGPNMITVTRGTTMYFECVTVDQEYHEVDRVNLVGTEMTGATLSGGSPDVGSRISHFIMNPAAATKVTAPVLSEITQSATINSATASNGTNIPNGQSYFVLGAGLTDDEIPVSGSIATNDVWVKVSGMTGTSWADSNGFYKVVQYSTSGSTITAIWVNLDSRPASGRDFSTYSGSGTVELIKCRDYVIQMEGTESKTTANCAYIENGTETSEGYSIKWELKSSTASPFYLEAGKGIAVSCYQQANTIFMREIVSGDIINTGSVKGASSAANFYDAANEVGKTRMAIVNENITDVVAEYSANDNVHLIDLNDSSDIKDVTETGAGRLYYDSTTEVTGSAYTWKVGDLIEDPTFKRVGDTGTNECVVGSRIHRSPKGHELMFNRMNAVVSAIEIPN